MNVYEAQLFEIAPWAKEILAIGKPLNGGALLRGRSGWIQRNIDNPESIYEHICKVSLAAYHLIGTKDSIDKGIIHDFPEILRPDLTPGQYDPDEKREQETNAMKILSEYLPNGDYWFNQWMDFENQLGVGLQIFELDKICPVIQALDYSQKGNGLRLGEFYPYARNKLKTPQLVDLLDSMQTADLGGKSAYTLYFNGLSEIILN